VEEAKEVRAVWRVGEGRSVGKRKEEDKEEKEESEEEEEEEEEEEDEGFAEKDFRVGVARWASRLPRRECG